MHLNHRNLDYQVDVLLEKEMQYCVNRTGTNTLAKLNPSNLGGHEL